MSKVNYRVCDICGNTLKREVRFLGHMNGCRIWNKLFNGLDICYDCLYKIKRLSIDKKDEEKYIKEVFGKARNYDNFGFFRRQLWKKQVLLEGLMI